MLLTPSSQYIIRGGLERRLKSKLWCFNFFGMLAGYTVVIVLNLKLYVSNQAVFLLASHCYGVLMTQCLSAASLASMKTATV